MEMKKNDNEVRLVNRVAESGLLTINLELYYPRFDFFVLDLKDYLFQGLILKEKDFREAMKVFEWKDLDNRILLITCSADAVIPLWAYMLVSSYAQPHAQDVFLGNQEAYLQMHYLRVINDLPLADYRDQRVVIKGCSDKPVPAGAYAALTRHLRPVVQSLFFGEPCSTVPIYKRPKVTDTLNS
ncbi:MAG: DUF2480 family protein [Saprospiraceae bacterium]